MAINNTFSRERVDYVRCLRTMKLESRNSFSLPERIISYSTIRVSDASDPKSVGQGIPDRFSEMGSEKVDSPRGLNFALFESNSPKIITYFGHSVNKSIAL